jgi:hypothetical protein
MGGHTRQAVQKQRGTRIGGVPLTSVKSQTKRMKFVITVARNK